MLVGAVATAEGASRVELDDAGVALVGGVRDPAQDVCLDAVPPPLDGFGERRTAARWRTLPWLVDPLDRARAVLRSSRRR
ncbi:hypothetical protein [Streptomyces sp. NPDC002172]